MKKLALAIVIMILIEGSIFAQPFTNITISTQNSPSEPSICLFPKNPNIIVAGCNINAVFYSTNGGSNWSPRIALQSSLYGVWGDPCIIVDTLGYFYYFHLSNPPSGGHWIDRIVCQKSTNNGVNWSNPGTYTYYDPYKDQDKEWAVVDPVTNYIYVTWTQFDHYGSQSQLDSTNILFSKSIDGGLTWVNWGSATAKRINKLGGDCVDSDNTVEGAVPAVGPNGEIYVAWAGPKIRNSQFGIFFDKSTDGGITWLDNDIYVADQPGGWDYNISGIYRANGLPITCCDLSNSPYRGYIYINWTDSAGPNDHDVKFVRSTNGGLNWSSPLRVNDDVGNYEQFFSWMTVDQKNGHIYIVFYDRRNLTGNQTNFYIARSTNGGASFSNYLVSSTPFSPSSSIFFGDYTNVTAYNGIVRPIWIRLDGINLALMTAIVDFVTETNNIASLIPSEYELAQNYPNPFNPITTIGYKLPKGGMVELKVFDTQGREVVTLVNQYQQAGSYTTNWDASRFPSGVYFYRLSSGEFTETKKMTLIK